MTPYKKDSIFVLGKCLLQCIRIYMADLSIAERLGAHIYLLQIHRLMFLGAVKSVAVLAASILLPSLARQSP